ncbi:MAG: hypothetical protein ACR2GO_07785 [Candidatus Limnocylindria bacterium]
MTLAAMSALQTPSTLSPMPSVPAVPRVPGVGMLRVLLLLEAVVGLALAIGLSVFASAQSDALEQTVRFAAGFSLLLAILAAVASRGARRHRSWAWTFAALLQLAVAIGTGIAVLVATWHPAYLFGFVLAGVVMLMLSAASVRRALGQE